jgi:(p)ppGpp synthase/HD superfamily hydrolase
MKDYIATPKPNGYQSLHTTVIPFLYESMFRLEVQVFFDVHVLPSSIFFW